jgi:hypothetical protein
MNSRQGKHKSTGQPDSPKTNEDFNKKQPKPHDPQLKLKPGEMDKKVRDGLLPDETADPGDADGNGNLIDHDRQDLWDEHEDTDIDFKVNKGIKNNDSREVS